MTQTSVTIQWPPINLYTADLRGIDVYRNSQKLSTVISPTATSVKLSGLDVNHDYEIYLAIRTSAGTFTSNSVRVKTHTMENLTGIHVAFGKFSNEKDVPILIELLKRIGAKYSEDVTIDNTHLVCNIPRGSKYEKASELNIPIVSPEFLKACETLGKIQPVGSYYVPTDSPRG